MLGAHTHYVPLRDLQSRTNRSTVDKALPKLKSWALVKLKWARFQAQLKQKLPKLPRWMKFTGWRMTVVIGAILSIAALLVNTVVLIWASQQPKDPQTGAAIIYSGPYDKTQNALIWSHLGINILSTLLLGSSNATLQCLTAPSREEV